VIGGVHPRVLGYLGRALSLEYSSVQQYMTHASLVELWGQTDAAERFRQETVEEIRHSERIVQQMLQLGVAPAASQLRPVRAASNLAQLLRLNMELEADLIQHYAEATRFCLMMRDEANGSFFRHLWEEEQQHEVDLDIWLQELDRNGAAGAEQRATF